MTIRLLIENKSNGYLSIPHPIEGSKLLKRNEIIDFICPEERFFEFIEQLEKSIKQNRILLKLNTSETRNPKLTLKFIKENSPIIYSAIITNDLSLSKYILNSKIDKTSINAFISYSTLDKIVAGKLKKILEKFNITTFLAHEDIEVSEEWKKRIVKELKRTDIFIPVLSNNFKESEWTAQEIGIIFSRKSLLIIPLSLDAVVPYGFINHLQGKRISENSIPIDILIKPIIEKFTKLMIPRVIDYLKIVSSFKNAEEIMKLLYPYYKIFEIEDINSFVNNCLNNSQILYSGDCNRKYLPDFIKINKNRISKNLLERLETKLYEY